MKHLIRTIAPVLVATAMVLPAAHAATGAAASSAMSTSHAIKYVSGGIDAAGREHMQRMAADYDLLLDFKGPTAHETYTGVNVKVTDDTDKVLLNASAGGPLFYTKVPPGHYTVSAELDGHTLRQSVSVAPHETSRLTFDWTS